MGSGKWQNDMQMRCWVHRREIDYEETDKNVVWDHMDSISFQYAQIRKKKGTYYVKLPLLAFWAVIETTF